jgi:hypothetical protein
MQAARALPALCAARPALIPRVSAARRRVAPRRGGVCVAYGRAPAAAGALIAGALALALPVRLHPIALYRALLTARRARSPLAPVTLLQEAAHAALHAEPGNALSLPTWAIHVASGALAQATAAPWFAP